MRHLFLQGIFFVFLSYGGGVSAVDSGHILSDPAISYQEATHTQDIKERSRLINEALSGFLTLRLSSPNEAWHYDVACCYYALNEVGAALFHLLFAKTLAPRSAQIDEMIRLTRSKANLPQDAPSLQQLRPFWSAPLFSMLELKIFFLVCCLTGTLFCTISFYSRIRGIGVAALFLLVIASATGAILFGRLLLTPIGVVVQAETVKGIVPPKTVIPGEEVYIEGVIDTGYRIRTAKGQQGLLSKQSCWPLE